MRQTYVIKSIKHSGRKDIRGKDVTDSKYDGLIGARCMTDIYESKQFHKMRLDIPASEINCPYDWWDTSEVLELVFNKKTREVYIETANTLYVLQEV